jgi:hypothetical protein
MNPYKGEVKLDIYGEAFTVVYDWNALAVIKAKYELNIFDELFQKLSPDVLADVLSAGLIKHHPEMTSEAVFTLSPPIIPCIEAINKAISYAFFALEAPPKSENKEVAPVKKKTLFQKVFS